MVDDFIKLVDAIKSHGILPAVVAIIILIILTFIGIYAARKTAIKPVEQAPAKKTAKPKKGLLLRLLEGWEKRQYERASGVLGIEPILPNGRADSIIEPMAFKDMLIRNQMLDFMNDNSWGDNGQPSRILIFSYHNGGHYASGDYMSRMSLRIQIQNKNSFLGEIQGDDVARGLYRIDYPLLYEKLFQQGRFYISNVQSIRFEDPRLYSLLTRANINAAYIQELVDKNKAPSGFLLVGYNEVPKDENYVTQKITVFSGYLSSTLNLESLELNKMFEEAWVKNKKDESVDKK